MTENDPRLVNPSAVALDQIEQWMDTADETDSGIDTEAIREWLWGMVHSYASTPWEGEDGVFPPDPQEVREAVAALMPAEDD